MAFAKPFNNPINFLVEVTVKGRVVVLCPEIGGLSRNFGKDAET